MTMGGGGLGLSALHFFVHVAHRRPASPGEAGEDRGAAGGRLHKNRLWVKLTRSAPDRICKVAASLFAPFAHGKIDTEDTTTTNT